MCLPDVTCPPLTLSGTVETMVPAQESKANRDFLEVLRYTADSGNAWFRELYKHGVFMPAQRARVVASMAWGLTVPCQTLRVVCWLDLRKGMDA